MLLDNGIATIWRAVWSGDPGQMPKRTFSQELFNSYFGNKTVGITRYWTAQAHDAKADLLIEIQRNSGISVADRCQLTPFFDGELSGYYKILQVQHVTDENGLPMTDLTLERIDAIDEP